MVVRKYGCLHSAIATSGLALRNRFQPPAAGLHALAVDAWGALVAAGAFLARVVDVDDIEGVNMTGYVSVGEEKRVSKTLAFDL